MNNLEYHYTSFIFLKETRQEEIEELIGINIMNLFLRSFDHDIFTDICTNKLIDRKIYRYNFGYKPTPENLDKLQRFLNKYPDRIVILEEIEKQYFPKASKSLEMSKKSLETSKLFDGIILEELEEKKDEI